MCSRISRLINYASSGGGGDGSSCCSCSKEC